MMLTDEELAEHFDVEYIRYCQTNPSAKRIVACHTDTFKEVDERQVRHMGYWWLRYKYGFTSYYQNHKIPSSLIKEINLALTKTVQSGYTRDSLACNLIAVFHKYFDFFDDVYDVHLKDQKKYQDERKIFKAKEKKTQSKDYTNHLLTVLVILVLIVLSIFYVR